MPAFSSTMRTVPGGNGDGPDGGAAVAEPLLTGSGPSPPVAQNSAAAATTTTARSAPRTSTHRERSRVGSGPLLITSSSPSHRDGSSGRAATCTPGPAGVVTSDHETPFHHRAVPGAPSGSAYQPGGGDGAVTASLQGRPRRRLRELPPQVGGGLGAAVQHGEQDALVGRVDAVGRQPGAEEQQGCAEVLDQVGLGPAAALAGVQHGV